MFRCCFRWRSSAGRISTKFSATKCASSKKIELDSIEVERDKLGRDIERYKRTYSALFAKVKPWTTAEKARVKLAGEELKQFQARLDEIKRHTREVCGPEK